MKAVFYNIFGLGHIHPTLPIVEKLVNCGVEVTYHSSPERRAIIEKAGARFCNYGYDSYKAADFNPGKNFVLQNIPAARGIFPFIYEEFEKNNYDIIFYDSMAPWGYCLGKIFGVPTFCSVTTFALNPQIRQATFDRYGIQIDDANQKALDFFSWEFGVDMQLIDSLGCYSEKNLVFTSEKFNPPLNGIENKTFYFMGAAMERREDLSPLQALSLEKWNEERSLNQKKVVFMSLGTLLTGSDAQSVDIFSHIINALGGQSGIELIISMGGVEVPLKIRELAASAENIHLLKYAPQLELLRKYVDIFIHHAGMNSTNEGLACGVPMLVLPRVNDQFVNADRVVELGLGKRLLWEEVSPDTVWGSIKELIEQPSYQQKCLAIKPSFYPELPLNKIIGLKE